MPLGWISKSKWRTWLAFGLVVCLLVIATLAIARQQLKHGLNETQQAAQRELRLVGSLVTETLRRGQYQHLDSLLQEWGRSHENLTELRVVGKSGFVLGAYRSGAAPAKVLNLSLPIEYAYRGQATLSLTRNLADVYADNTELRNQLLVLMLLLSALLSAVLFLLLKRQDEASKLRSHTQALDAAHLALQKSERRLRDLIDGLGPSMFVGLMTPEGILIEANRAALEMANLKSEDVLGKPLEDTYWLSYSDEIKQQLRAAIARAACGEPSRYDMVVRAANNQLITIDFSLQPLRDETGKVAFLVPSARDITERRIAEEALFQAKERAEVTLESIGDAVITTDALGVVDYLNPVAEALTGWSLADAMGQPLDKVFPIFSETTREPVENPVARCLREGVIVGLANHTMLITRDGREIAIEDSAAPIRARNGEITGVVMVFHDVTHSREMAQKLSWQAAHDALTGLVNRREFEQRLQKALDTSRAEGQQHALLYIDLDQFKIVNDTCGHVAGDELLRQLSALLQRQMRASDTLARLGGDEFGVLLENCPMDQAQRIADNLRIAIRDFRLIWENKTFEMSASMGMIALHRGSGTLAQVLSAVDIACYVAKERGRNRVHVYQESDADFARRHGEMLWVSRLNQALRDNRFVLYRQEIRPIAAAPSSRFCEVLLRIRNEDGSLSLPGSFLPAAERYGLMCAIDRWVVQHLFSQHALWQPQDLDAGADALHLFTINLSGASLNDETFLDFARDAIKHHNINPQSICFEITETVAITHFDRTIQLVTALREIGCRFALDDFGSGLSSFGYLKNLPMDFLKIDGGLVRHIVDNPIDAAMVEAINDIGHVMGLQTIAEYVENDAIHQKLASIGVDFIQGFGIAIPEPFPTESSVSDKMPK